jgi:hypothetical protein
MITSKQYVQVNDSLSQLQTVLGNLGVVEFVVSERQHTVKWQLDKEIDPLLLEKFCKAVQEMNEKEERRVAMGNEPAMVA